MAGYSPHNYMAPNSEIRSYGGKYYEYTPTNVEDMGWGAIGKGGTVKEVATPQGAGNIFSATISPEAWTAAGQPQDADLLKSIQTTFSGMDPQNTSKWQDYLSQNQTSILQKTKDYLSQNQGDMVKAGGNLWNEFRYNPANASAIRQVQASGAVSGAPARPEFTSQEQANVYGKTGQMTTPEQRTAAVTSNQPSTTQTPGMMNSSEFYTAYQQQYGKPPTTAEITDWANAGRPALAPKETGPQPGTISNGVYTIQRGDTLSSLAKKYGTTVAELMKLNPHTITNPNLISAGASMNVPGGGSTGGTGAAPAGGTGGTGGTTEVGATQTPQLTDEDIMSALQRQLGIETETSNLSASAITSRMKQQQDLTNQINQLPADLQDRVKDFVVNNAQLGRITSKEAKPLKDLLTAINDNITLMKEETKEEQDAKTAKIQLLKDWFDLQKAQNELDQKDLQFISATKNQASGYFNKDTGEFTPYGKTSTAGAITGQTAPVSRTQSSSQTAQPVSQPATKELTALLKNYPLEFKSYIQSHLATFKFPVTSANIGELYQQYMALKTTQGILPSGSTAKAVTATKAGPVKTTTPSVINPMTIKFEDL